MALNDLQEIIERSLFEAVRLRAVAEGLTPDISTFPNTESGFAAYQAALASMYQTNGMAVEIFNNVAPEDMGYKKVPRVVFASEFFYPGEYGLEPGPQLVYDEDLDQWHRELTDNLTYEMSINVHVVAETVPNMRTLVALLNASLPLRGYNPYYYNTDEAFFMELSNFFNISSTDDGIKENVYKYRIPDIIWNEPIRLITNVAKIKDATINHIFLTHSGLSPGLTIQVQALTCITQSYGVMGSDTGLTIN